jgi:hypothetical protein
VVNSLRLESASEATQRAQALISNAGHEAPHAPSTSPIAATSSLLQLWCTLRSKGAFYLCDSEPSGTLVAIVCALRCLVTALISVKGTNCYGRKFLLHSTVF